MIKIRIKNADHEIDVRFPISENELYAKLAEIHAIEEKDAPQSAFVTEVYWPEEFSMLKDRFANLDELNYLAKRMESFDYHEYDQFLIGITKLQNPTEKDLINLTFNLDHFTLCKDVSSYGKIGREYVMNTQGAVPANDEDDPKYAAIGKELIDKACSTLEYIIKTTEQMGNNYLVDLFDFSFNYARCLHEKGNDTLSKEYYNKCIDIWDSMSGGGSRNLCLVFQEYGDILFSEMNPGEALSKYESALKYNTEDWYIEVDLIDSIAACMMLIGQTDESLQKFAWLLQTLAEDDVKDAETKFQLCNNLACVLNSETEEEIEYKESLFDLVKDDAAVLSYAIHYLDDWLPDSAE